MSTTGSAVAKAARAAAGSTTAIGSAGRNALGPARQEVRIGEKVEGMQLELGAPPPRRERDVGSDTGRLAEGQRQWPRIGLAYLYSIIALRRISCRYCLDFCSNRSANRVSRGLLLTGRVVGRGLLLRADREHLDAGLGDFGRRQLADLDALEHLAQLRRKVGRAADDLVAHGDVLERAGEGDAVLAALEAPAQRFRLALAPVDEGFGRAGRDDEQDRPQRVVVADRVVGLAVHRRQDVLLGDLEGRLVAPAHELLPSDVGLDLGFEGVGVDAGLGERLGQLLGRAAHPAGHRGKGGVDLGSR